MASGGSTNRVFLLSSVVLGVVAMLAAFVYLENGAGQDGGPKVQILVAKRDLRANAALDPEKDLTTLDIPAKMSDLQSRALSDAKTNYKGQKINRDILSGTPVLKADLFAAATLELKGDNRALSIPVKGVNALGGLLIPGDMVKVMVTRPANPPPSLVRPTTGPFEDPVIAAPAAPNRWETVLVAPQAFKVLAVNQRLSRSRMQLTAGEQYSGAGESTSQQTVTLEVTEQQAKTILEQTGGGQLAISLLLCPPDKPAP